MAVSGPGMGKARPVRTSLLLEVFFYFGGIFDAVWWLLELILFVYKGIHLPYPTSNFTMEFVFLWLYLVVAPARLFLGSKGNKTESHMPLIFSLVLSLPLVALHVYYMLFQTYVLRLELVLNGASLFFLGVQGLISIIKVPVFISRK